MSGLSAILPYFKRLGEHSSSHDLDKGNKKNKNDKDKSGGTEERPHQQFTPLTLPLGEVFCDDLNFVKRFRSPRLG